MSVYLPERSSSTEEPLKNPQGLLSKDSVDTAGPPIFGTESPKKPTLKTTEILNAAKEIRAELPVKTILVEMQKRPGGRKETARAAFEKIPESDLKTTLFEAMKTRWPGIFGEIVASAPETVQASPETPAPESYRPPAQEPSLSGMSEPVSPSPAHYETPPQPIIPTEDELKNSPQTPETPPIPPPETATGTPGETPLEGITENIPDPLPGSETETPETPPVSSETISTPPQQPPQPQQNWFRRLFGGGGSSGGGPKKPGAKNGGFLSNLLNSKWARRLALASLIFRGGSHAEGQAVQDTEPKNSNFGEIGSMVIEGVKDNFQHQKTFENFISKLKTEKAKAWQEVAKIGTVGPDNDHNRLIILFKNQLKNRPGLLTEAESSESIDDLAERIANEAKLLTTGLNHEAINNLVVDVQRDQKTGKLVPAYFDVSGKSLSFEQVSDSYFYNLDSNLDSDEVKVSPEVKSIDSDRAIEDYASELWAADALFEYEKIKQDLSLLGEGAKELSDSYNAYEQALKTWLALAAKTAPQANDEGELQLSNQLIDQDLEALAQLNKTAKNLKLSIQHQELAQNPMGHEVLRRTYEKAFNDWEKGISKQSTSGPGVPESVNFFEKQLEEYGQLLESDQGLEQQNQDFSERMSELDSESVEKNLKEALKRVYARYLVTYQTHKLKQQDILSTNGFGFNPKQLPEIQRPVETVGELLENLLFLATCDEDFPKKIRRRNDNDFEPNFKQDLAKYLAARENLKRTSSSDTNFESLVNKAVSLGVELQMVLDEKRAAAEVAAEAKKK